jgi:hypothetical protein
MRLPHSQNQNYSEIIDIRACRPADDQIAQSGKIAIAIIVFQHFFGDKLSAIARCADAGS